MPMKIAIVGATGQVGQTLLHLLESQNFPAEQLILIASERSAGKYHIYLGRNLLIHHLADFNFANISCAFFAAGSEVAKRYAPLAAAAGCTVIDKSAYFRLDPHVPLVVPEVNGETLAGTNSKIIAVPNCSTIPLVMALKPLEDLAGIERVEVATYQAVSGAGNKGIKALKEELKNIPTLRLGAPIAFNVIPKIDEVLSSGFTKEEMKMHEETQKILERNFVVNATAVRVPVWQGHSEAVVVKTRRPIEISQAAQAFQNFKGIHYLEEEIPTPLTHAANNAGVWLGRLRRHPQDSAHYLNFWLTCDNLYKGAAWNAIQIAEKMGYYG